MYKSDFRGRVATYEQMRQDQDRVNQLLTKSRDLKLRMKKRREGHERGSHSGKLPRDQEPYRRSPISKRAASSSPVRDRAIAASTEIGSVTHFSVKDPSQFS